jgi:pyruvate,water dikinase
VIQSLTEFEHLQQGDVLVIPYSDVSWTPLFSKAGAFVAESGGILSHSSIVAREHNLPAVVSVTGACQLLTNGTTVLIDGYKGDVILSKDGGRKSF